MAYATVDGEPTSFGVNSRGPGYNPEDRAAANQMRDTMIAKYPGVMATENKGEIPNDALYHAEATTLLRAARDNGGSLAGKNLDVYVDRTLCGSCMRVLPYFTRELGYPTVRFRDADGVEKTIRNGYWE